MSHTRILVGCSRNGYYTFKTLNEFASPDCVFNWQMTESDVLKSSSLAEFLSWYLNLPESSVLELFGAGVIKIHPKNERGLILMEFD